MFTLAQLGEGFSNRSAFSFLLAGLPLQNNPLKKKKKIVNVTAPSESRVAGWQVKFIVTSWYILQTQDTRLDDT